jgi:putative lipoic acid-binding regulatory protein
METIEGKPEIKYPTNWGYKVIGEDKTKVHEAIKSIVCNKDHSICESKKSKTGKYTSYSVEILVFSDDERVYFFEEFRKHIEIKFVV